MRVAVAILAIFLLLSIVFLPMYNRGIIADSIWPNDRSVYFGEAMEFIFEGELQYYVCQFTLAALIPGVLLAIFSLCNVRSLSIFFSALGAVSMIALLIIFIGDQGLDYVIDFSDTSICIGYYINLILFILCFFLSLPNSPSTSKTYSSSYANKLSKIGSDSNSSVPPNSWVCKACGEINTNLSSGCKKCGNRR